MQAAAESGMGMREQILSAHLMRGLYTFPHLVLRALVQVGFCKMRT